MKYIFLLRHAKSSWDDLNLRDFDRPLSKRGFQDAPKMGKFLRKISYRPEYIVSSPAERARQTTLLCLEGMKKDESLVTWDHGLYFETVASYFKAIHKTPTNRESIMLVGHNPLIEETVGVLSGGKHSTVFRVPTAGLVCLESYAIRWDEINPGTCQVKWMMIPKILKELI